MTNAKTLRPTAARLDRSRRVHWLALLLLGCGASPESTLAGAGASGSAGAAASSGAGGYIAGTSGAGGAGGTSALNGTRPRCRAPAGVSDSPRTIEEAVTLLNALPKPTNAACFVESLARPLFAFATSSTISAQPALSFTSPRVLLRLNQLLLSVVIDGDSSRLIEFGYLSQNDTRSIKGEVKLPLTEPLPRSAPYDRVMFNEGTICGACHGPERREENIDFATAYVSVAFRPNSAYQVPLASLVHEKQICDRQLEPERCEMLAALFDGGQVSDAQFSEEMPIFF